MGIAEYSDAYFNYKHTYDSVPNIDEFYLHTHSDYEVYIFLSGKGTYMVEGTEYKLRPGNILIFRSGEAHMLKIDNSEPYERITVNFLPEFIEKTDPELKMLTPFLNRPLGRLNCYTNISSIEKLIGVSNKCGCANYLQKMLLTNAVNNILLEIYLSFEEKEERSSEENKPELMSQIVEYVNRNLYDDISLNRISKHFFISKSQLNRSFKKFTGSTAWGYITAKRLLRARRLIWDGESAKSACQQSGFEDYSAFFRAYKKRFGCSPSENRRHLKNN